MIQKQIPHPASTFTSCCRREPAHLECHGRSKDEAAAKPIDYDVPAVRHVLTCNICGRSTARHATLDAAVDEWGAANAQGALALRVVAQRRRAA